jgi:hypothetical protein
VFLLVVLALMRAILGPMSPTRSACGPTPSSVDSGRQSALRIPIMVLLIGAPAGVYAADPESEQLMRAPQKEVVGRASEVEDRGSMQDQQGWGTNLSAVVNGPGRAVPRRRS